MSSYTHSSAHTNAALDYLPTPSPLGAQQSGPLPWDVPNRVISWGWLPVPFAKLRKRWDFVYLFDRHTGFPYTAVNAADQVVGAAGAQRFPDYCELQSGAGVEISFSRTVLGAARRDGERDGQQKPAGGEQRDGLAGVWDIQRVPGKGVYSADPADRDEVKLQGPGTRDQGSGNSGSGNNDVRQMVRVKACRSVRIGRYGRWKK